MGTAVFLVGFAVVVLYVGAKVYRNRRSLVPRRGFGIAQDVATLGAAPVVRVTRVERTAPDRARVVFTRESDPGAEDAVPAEFEFDVALQEGDFGADVLDGWRRDASAIAIVIPPDSHLVRLRSIESLQHLTLRRVHES